MQETKREVFIRRFEDAVDMWHASESDKPIEDYLEISHLEYLNYVRDPNKFFDEMIQKEERNMPMGTRLKGYEEAARSYLDPELPVVIRLDGVGFSKFTKKLGCEKPYDEFFSATMRSVSADLMVKFSFATVYTQSDEITCVFPRKTPEQDGILYSGRIEKLASIVAAYATAKFNYYLYAYFAGNRNYHIGMLGLFDARVFNVPTEAEALNCIIWRQQDCLKNARNGFAQALCSHKELQGLTSQEQVKYAEERHEDAFFDAMPPSFRFGTIFKRSLMQTTGFDPKQNKVVPAVRTTIESLNLMLSFSEENIELVMGKYYEPEKYWLI